MSLHHQNRSAHGQFEQSPHRQRVVSYIQPQNMGWRSVATVRLFNGHFFAPFDVYIFDNNKSDVDGYDEFGSPTVVGSAGGVTTINANGNSGYAVYNARVWLDTLYTTQEAVDEWSVTLEDESVMAWEAHYITIRERDTGEGLSAAYTTSGYDPDAHILPLGNLLAYSDEMTATHYSVTYTWQTATHTFRIELSDSVTYQSQIVRARNFLNAWLGAKNPATPVISLTMRHFDFDIVDWVVGSWLWKYDSISYPSSYGSHIRVSGQAGSLTVESEAFVYVPWDPDADPPELAGSSAFGIPFYLFNGYPWLSTGALSPGDTGLAVPAYPSDDVPHHIISSFVHGSSSTGYGCDYTSKDAGLVGIVYDGGTGEPDWDTWYACAGLSLAPPASALAPTDISDGASVSWVYGVADTPSCCPP